MSWFQYRDRYLTIDDAQQMLFCMSSEAVYNNRPQLSRSTPTDILRHAIYNEVMGLTKHRAYAGEFYWEKNLLGVTNGL